MNNILAEKEAASHRPTIKDWLFNPFTYLAGGAALLIGLLVIALAGFIGSFGNVHFDGVLDAHLGLAVPMWMFIGEGVINWLSLSVMLLIVGKIVTKTPFRAIDLFGTQAFARWPTLLISLIMLSPSFQRATTAIVAKALNPLGPLQASPIDMIIFAIASFIMIAAIVLMVALMYRSYSICCNIKGAKAAVSFIVGLLAAEIISKVIFHYLYKAMM